MEAVWRQSEGCLEAGRRQNGGQMETGWGPAGGRPEAERRPAGGCPYCSDLRWHSLLNPPLFPGQIMKEDIKHRSLFQGQITMKEV